MADRVSGAGASEASFNFEELIAALRAAEPGGEPSGETVQELSERLLMAPQTVRKYLRAGLATGRVRHVRVKRTRMNGILALVDAYERVVEDGGNGSM
jgi:predicted transcriptional regulator